MSKNILLIDKRVQCYESIVSSINSAICVPVLFDYYVDTIDTIKEKVLVACSSMSPSTPRCVGLIQHNYNMPHYWLLAGDAGPGSIVKMVHELDPALETWSVVRDFIAWLKATLEVNAGYFDMMACALYSDPDWKYIIDTLETQTGIIIRASTDDTGAASLGGNWFLESHTGVNLKDVYFIEAIDDCNVVLGLSIPSNVDNMIIACDEGEQITIDGKTLVNYGTFVYQVDASNNFTKVTSVVLNGVTYSLYGGDGVNSSGIVLLNTTSLIPSNVDNMIIACDEGEQITIDGKTLVNYGTFVYQVDASNNFTKVTSVVLNGVTYSLYGGDGVNSSGIVLLKTVELDTPSLSSSTFTVASNKTYGDASFAITTLPTSNSSGAITYTSSNTAVATIDASGNFITLVAAGTVTFTATQAATSQYANATKTSNTLTVALGTPNLSSSTFMVASNKTYGDASFAITTRPTSNSGGAITYTSNNTVVATIDASGNFITLVGAGDVSFNATQAATSQYASATKTSNTLTVTLGTPNLSSSTFTIASSKAYGDASFAIITRPTSNSGGAITYTSSNTAVATIDASGNWITIVAPGDVTFTASQAAVPNQFTSATKTSNTLTVSKGTPSLTFSSPPSTKNVTDASFSVTASSASSGAVTYTSSNTSFATVHPTSGLVTLKSAGTVTITAAQAESALYNAPTNATCSIVISNAGSALAGQTVSSGTSFAGVNLSGASFAGSTLSGVSFSGATLTNVNFSGAVITGTDFTNANISGASNLPAFSVVQKLQLLKNINNVGISAVQVPSVSGSTIASVISATIPGISDLSFSVVAPSSLDASGNKVVTLTGSSIGSSSIYLPINTSDTVKINGSVYSSNGTNILNANNEVVNYITIDGLLFNVYAGSLVGINITNDLNAIKIRGTGLYSILSEVFQLA